MASIGDKVAHVKRAGQTRDHTCHWPGCRLQVPPAMWGCRPHWYAIPKPLRDLIWATYKPGQEIRGTPSVRYLEAAKAVQAWINENAGKGIVIVYGPPASGKTRHATQLLREYGCRRVIDDWDGQARLQGGDLALTQEGPPYTLPAAKAIAIGEALVQLELARP